MKCTVLQAFCCFIYLRKRNLGASSPPLPRHHEYLVIGADTSGGEYKDSKPCLVVLDAQVIVVLQRCGFRKRNGQLFYGTHNSCSTCPKTTITHTELFPYLWCLIVRVKKYQQQYQKGSSRSRSSRVCLAKACTRDERASLQQRTWLNKYSTFKNSHSPCKIEKCALWIKSNHTPRYNT